MVASEYRALARQKLSGKWSTPVLITLIIGLITGAIAGLSGYTYGISDIILLFIGGPFVYAAAYYSLALSRNGDVKVEDSFVGFKDFERSLLAYIINNVFIFLWSLLLIIPGIIKSLSYSMTFFIMLDDKNISANEARKKSMEMMDGHKWELFCLYFSFIGWILLSILTLGILMLWIEPYMNVAKAEFYKNIKGESDVVETEATAVEPEPAKETEAATE